MFSRKSFSPKSFSKKSWYMGVRDSVVETLRGAQVFVRSILLKAVTHWQSGSVKASVSTDDAVTRTPELVGITRVHENAITAQAEIESVWALSAHEPLTYELRARPRTKRAYVVTPEIRAFCGVLPGHVRSCILLESVRV